MSRSREIDLKAILRDIRSGTCDSDLMDRYDMTCVEFRDVLKYLSDSGAIKLVNARNLLNDIKLGMTNKALMKKYRLSPAELKKTFLEMTKAGIVFFGNGERSPTKIKVKTEEIAGDIRAGMSETELMKVYNLSSRGLQSTFWKLVQSGILSWDEILGLKPSKVQSMIFPRMRKWLRGYPLLFIAVCEEGNPMNIGKMKDLSEKGVGVLGISAKVGDLKKLIVAPVGSFDLKPFRISGICRWSNSKNSASPPHAGFELTDSEDNDIASVEELLQFVTLTIA
jgi:uncharacterized protein (DUF433 family)